MNRRAWKDWLLFALAGAGLLYAMCGEPLPPHQGPPPFCGMPEAARAARCIEPPAAPPMNQD